MAAEGPNLHVNAGGNDPAATARAYIYLPMAWHTYTHLHFRFVIQPLVMPVSLNRSKQRRDT